MSGATKLFDQNSDLLHDGVQLLDGLDVACFICWAACVHDELIYPLAFFKDFFFFFVH